MLHSYQKPLVGKNVGMVFGSFAPLHQGHLDLIMRAKKENDAGAIVIVWTVNAIYGWWNWSKLNKRQNNDMPASSYAPFTYSFDN